MKAWVVGLVLVGMYCFGGSRGYAGPARGAVSQISYAMKNGWFKKVCPECEGARGCSTWYGGWESCKRCGGSGKVPRTWLFVAAVIVVGLAVVAEFDKKK